MRRTPVWLHRGRGHTYSRSRPLVWDAQTAYAVGLAATDGCLLGDGRHVAFGSEDRDLVVTFLRCVGRAGGRISKDRDADYYRAQLGDVELFRFLTSAGLSPRKSLTLGALYFPAELFWDVARGLIDGDGTVRHYVHNPIRRTNATYRYEHFHVHFLTASLRHAQWIHGELAARGLLSALIREDRTSSFNGQSYVMYKVQLGKHASIELAGHMYADPSAPRLMRKWRIWEEFRARYSDAEEARLVRKAGAAGRSYAAVSRTAGLHAHEGSNPSSGTDSSPE